MKMHTNTVVLRKPSFEEHQITSLDDASKCASDFQKWLSNEFNTITTLKAPESVVRFINWCRKGGDEELPFEISINKAAIFWIQYQCSSKDDVVYDVKRNCFHVGPFRFAEGDHYVFADYVTPYGELVTNQFTMDSEAFALTYDTTQVREEGKRND
jgi:hypothetical protein